MANGTPESGEGARRSEGPGDVPPAASIARPAECLVKLRLFIYRAEPVIERYY